MRSIKFIGAIALAVFIAGFATTVFALVCTVDADCAGNTCLTGTCTSSVCVTVADGTLCNADSNFCTGSVYNTATNDACASGVCVAGPLKVCTTTNTCKTQGACVTSTGNCPTATNKSVGTACDDGNTCTLNDACAAGGICRGTTNFCRDTNPCTEDACSTATGCSNTPVGTSVCGAACTNPIPDDSKLLITGGQGSATNVPCSVGSCFSMVNGTDIIWTDILPGTDGGFWLGHAQASGGQELPGGGAIQTTGALTKAWYFFNNYGTFFTAPTSTLPLEDGGLLNKFCGTACSGYDCINKTELKVFTVAWNGGPILMGSRAGCVLSHCSAQQNNDVMVNDWQIDPVDGGAWSMDYAQVVPTGSFANVNFKAILRGTLLLKNNPCNDNNPCTNDLNDSSDPAVIHCVYSNNTAACDDGNACTTGDVCSNGACQAGTTPLNCDDNDVCTTDSCDSAAGCVHTAIAGCMLSAPTLVQPPDGQAGVLTTVEFRWTKSTNNDNDPVTYKIFYCTTPGAADCAPATVAQKSTKGVLYAGGAGLFMIGITFFGGMTGRKRNVLLILILVLSVSGAVMSCKAKNETELPAEQSNYVASGLTSGTTYYWKVAAINGTTGATTDSAVQSFTTE